MSVEAVTPSPGRKQPTPLELDATSRRPEQTTPAEPIGSPTGAATPTSPVEIQEATPESGQARKNSSGWVELQDPHYGFRFAVPCFWHVGFPESYGSGQAYSIKNYSLAYALSFPPDIDDMWDRGGIKIDIVFPKRVHRSISMLDYINQSQRENPDSRLVSIEELTINDQEALLVTTESSFGSGQFVIFTLSDEAFMIFSPSPGAHQSPDVQAILKSITMEPDIALNLPDFSPGAPIEGVITDCRGANQLEALLAGPQSIPWAGGEPVTIYFALVNLTDQELYLLNWLTPFEGIAGDIFRVERDGQPVSYHGILASRGDPSPEAYMVIEPKGALTTEVNLSEIYDFSRPGSYEVAFKSPHTSSIAQTTDDFAKTLDELGLVLIPSNEIVIEIVLEE
jgi:hypothetical protein